MNIQQFNSSNRIIFWTIIVTAIVIVILLLTVSTIYQTRNEQAQATRIAIPTVTAEALEAIYQKGLAYINIEYWPEAKRELETVFEVNPNYKEVQAKLIEIQTKLSELDLESDSQGNTPPLLTPVSTDRSSEPISIPIAKFANGRTQDGYATVPLGQVELGGVLFDLPTGQNVIKTQAVPLPNFPTKLYFEANVFAPEQVHLLIAGGNTFSYFNGQHIGEIRLHFSKAQPTSIPLIAGQNIRDWRIQGELTVGRTTSSQVKEVWRVESLQGGTGIIDLLSIDLSDNYASDSLIAVEVIDSSMDTIGSMDPAINLIGITVIGH